MSPAKLLLTVSAILCGIYPSKYCVHRDVKQLREGATLQNRAVIKFIADAQKLDGFPKFYTLASALFSCRLMQTCCAVSVEWNTLSSQILGSEGQNVMEVSDMYTANFRNYHARMMTASK